MTEKKQGIIFDLDGTLWDACLSMARSWEEYIRIYEPQWYARGVRVEEKTVRAACGKTMDIFTSMLLHQLPEEEQKRLYHPCCAYEIEYLKTHGGVLYPELVPTMRALAQTYALFIVSNCQEGYIRSFTAYAGVEDLITDTEDYGTTGLTKDRNIRLIVERNHLEQAVYVGDTAGDYDSTKKAGLPFIFAAYGFGDLAQGQKAEGVIGAFRDLPGAAKAVFAADRRN